MNKTQFIWTYLQVSASLLIKRLLYAHKHNGKILNKTRQIVTHITKKTNVNKPAKGSNTNVQILKHYCLLLLNAQRLLKPDFMASVPLPTNNTHAHTHANTRAQNILPLFHWFRYTVSSAIMTSAASSPKCSACQTDFSQTFIKADSVAQFCQASTWGRGTLQKICLIISAQSHMKHFVLF